MKIYLAIILLFLFTECDGNIKKTDDQSTIAASNNVYPEEIRRLGIEPLYDKAKWYLYCIHCDDTVIFSKGSEINEKNITCGTLPLIFDHVDISNDTIEIDFFFHYNNVSMKPPLIENDFTWGAVFTGGTDSIMMYTTLTTAKYYWLRCEDPNVNCHYRTVKPLQPEVIKYIKANKDKLDPWFRKEAIKRGVINE